MFSCAICEDYPYDKKALTYKNKFVFDNQFRMDGYYLMKTDYGGHTARYFFQDGFYHGVGIDSSEIGIECFQIPSKVRNWPYVWGCFIIEDGILKVQTYDPGSMNRYTKYKVIEQWGEIVNDTTIHFFKCIDTEGKSSQLDKTFHFHHCENKPDSTNILMRN